MLYFAYGSNMLTSRMVKRVPSAKKVTIATLPGHKLMFHKVSVDGTGKCDIMPVDTGDTVYGVVYWIPRGEKRYLDRAEGLHYGYETKRLTVYTPDGQRMRVFAYYATDVDVSYKPSKAYKRLVVKGAHEHQLPADYIAKLQAVETVPTVVKPATQVRIISKTAKKERPANIKFTFKPSRPGTPTLTEIPKGTVIKQYDEKGRLVGERVV